MRLTTLFKGDIAGRRADSQHERGTLGGGRVKQYVLRTGMCATTF